MDNFGNLLTNAGLHLQAVSVTQEAERIFRKLAAADPGRYEWGLAFLLSNLGSRLARLGAAGGGASPDRGSDPHPATAGSRRPGRE